MARRKSPPAPPGPPNGGPSGDRGSPEDIARTRRLVDGHLAGDLKPQGELVNVVETTVLDELPRTRLWKRLRRRYEPQEVVDELWVRLLRGRVLEKFKWQYQGSLRNEIRQILGCQLVDMNRRLSSDKAGGGVDPLPLEPSGPDEVSTVQPPARDATPSVQAWTAEARALVRKRLSPDQHEVFDLWCEGYTLSEIADRLGRPQRSVRKVFDLIERLYGRYRKD